MRFFNGQWLYLNYTANNYLVIQGFCYFSTLVTYAYTKLKPRGLRVKLAVLGGMGRSCIFAYWKGILTLSQLRKDCSFWALALKVQRKSTEAFLPPRVRKWEVPELNWYIFWVIVLLPQGKQMLFHPPPPGIPGTVVIIAVHRWHKTLRRSFRALGGTVSKKHLYRFHSGGLLNLSLGIFDLCVSCPIFFHKCLCGHHEKKK